MRALTWISLALLFATPNLLVAAAGGDTPRLFVDVDETTLTEGGRRDIRPQVYRTMSLDLVELERILDLAPFADDARTDLELETAEQGTVEQVEVELPFPDGTYGRFAIVEAPIMAPELAAKFPRLRTFRGQGLDDPTASVRFDLTPQGFHAMVLAASGSVLIDPYQRGDRDHYVVYDKAGYSRPQATGFTCGVEAEESPSLPVESAGSLPSNGGTLRTYRLALAVTAEYTAFHSTGPPNVPEGMAAVVTAMNRVNGIYERELSLTMQLVANNDLLIYTNSVSDPYTNGNGFLMAQENQDNLDAVIGTSNYDIGHAFSTDGGGFALLRGPCDNDDKARGITGIPAPNGDPFWVDYVAHEIGHQWAGTHAFNGSVGFCAGFGRNPDAAYEPGSGSTIQSYAGLCDDQNLQLNSDDYFHTISLQQMLVYGVVGHGGTCAMETATGNGVPTVDAGPSFTIPLDTPFELCATGSDPNSDPLTFNWEQFNLGPEGHPDSPVGDAPIFRSWPSTVSPCRTFPRLESILTGTSTIGELLPSYARTLTFRVTARDNRAAGGAFNTDQVDIVVSDQGGPFQVTAPETAVIWDSGTGDVTWDVAGTDLAPINCGQVDILVSADGGQTFPHMVASATANDGAETVTAPAVSTNQARVKVQCSANIFFDISGVDFTIETNNMIFTDGFESGDTSSWTGTFRTGTFP